MNDLWGEELKLADINEWHNFLLFFLFVFVLLLLGKLLIRSCVCRTMRIELKSLSDIHTFILDNNLSFRNDGKRVPYFVCT